MGDGESQEAYELRSINSMSTEEWRRRYEADGAVDLWVEEEFNSGSRLSVPPPPPPFSGELSRAFQPSESYHYRAQLETVADCLSRRLDAPSTS